MIDSAHIDQFIRIPSAQSELDRLIYQFTTLQRVNRMGLMAMRPSTIPERGFSGETLRQYRGVLASRNYFLAAMEEGRLVRESLEEGVQVLNHINVPVVVVTRGRADGLNDEEFAAWQSMQRELLTVSARSKQVIAKQSGHYIHMDQPEVVVQEIKMLLQQ